MKVRTQIIFILSVTMLFYSLLLYLCNSMHSSLSCDYNYTEAVQKPLLSKKPKRIMTTHIYLDNVVLGLVEPDRMISMSKNMDNPAECYINFQTLNIPNRITTPSLEQVLRLKPDLLIVHDFLGIERIECYKQLDIPVYVVKLPTSITGVKKLIFDIAGILGEHERGDILIKKMDRILVEIQNAIPDEIAFSKSSVLLAENHAFYGGLNCIYDDICQYARVRNAVSELGIINGQTVSKEAIIQTDPDYVFLSKRWDNNIAKDRTLIRNFMNDESMCELKALKNNNIVPIENKYIFVGNQNCVWAVQRIANVAYGKRIQVRKEEFLKSY